jgi:hypothetical protein
MTKIPNHRGNSTVPCFATETEIILVDEKNFEIEKYEERAKVTYKDYHGNEQVKNYVIDPYGHNWIIITSEGVLNWYREGERKSKRSHVSHLSFLS